MPRPTFRPLRRLLLLVLIPALVLLPGLQPAAAAPTRIKDIVDIEGVRDNLLVGYGLIVGLDGTGDSINNSPFTEQSLIAMLERLGVNVRGDTLRTENVAAVMVTATLKPFASQGTRMDVDVAALGDSESLRGGTLLVTPLLGADGAVYAVAQGAVQVGGFSAGGDAERVVVGVPTNGRISNGAIIEREIGFELAAAEPVRLSLRNPDFTTARRIVEAINDYLGVPAARMTDPATVLLSPVPGFDNGMVELITEIEQLTVQPDQIARVVISESTGVIVMGDQVRISTVAIAQGSLTIRITETPQVSQPPPFADNAETVVVPRTDVEVTEGNNRIALLPSGVTLQTLVAGLNALGVGPRDIISILQAIKAAGALQAEIVVM